MKVGGEDDWGRDGDVVRVVNGDDNAIPKGDVCATHVTQVRIKGASKVALS